jgi:site-specific DNA-methyltransferase (adenine-specific)
MKSQFFPDVLETIAQLPTDDVYTAPRLANRVLDALPAEVWTDQPGYRWLDPGTKSGVFLREAYRRLMTGLVGYFPDPRHRREHILQNMLFGAATTQLNGEMARRTLYQSIDATGESVVDSELQDILVRFDDREGNISYVKTEHTLDPHQRACLVCRAPGSLVRKNRENFAYSFIHNTYPDQERQSMKFDVIIGNPPYQIGMEDDAGNRTANITPLYNLFVEKAIEMEPRYVIMITPSRWFAGGKGLQSFRARMIADRRLREIVDIPNAKNVFPTVEVKGGVSYFLWDREWDGDCKFSSYQEGEIVSSDVRDLRKYGDVILRDSSGLKIVDKVLSSPSFERGLDTLISNRDPFGQSITSNFKGAKAEPFPRSVPLIYNNQVGFVDLVQLERNHSWVDKWKVIIPKASDGVWRESASVLGEPIALAPGSACTQSYLVAGTFESETETKNMAEFLTTKFCRFLVLQKKITQNMTASMFSFVPRLDLSASWSDKALYTLFDLDGLEIEYIEKAIGPREWINSLTSPIPETHLPGGRKYKSTLDPDEVGDE